jgi:hypothetical protein
LEYNDEEGKPISAKEAFRLLSHKFHGKGSGKNKIDKKRRKVDQDKVNTYTRISYRYYIPFFRNVCSCI